MNLKLPLTLLVLAVTISGFAQTAPGKATIDQIVPLPTQGVNLAANPVPRVDWVARVKTNIERARKQANDIHIIFDGDSITDGWQAKGKEIWAQRYAALGAFDFGISGDRTEHLLWRLEQGQVDGLKPKLIALMIGTNNLGQNTAEEIAAGVAAIVKSYQQRCPDAVILLQAIFPRSPKADGNVRAKIKAINAIIAGLGDGKKVIYLDFGDKFLEPDGSLSPEVMPDFLHPSAKGYQIWADAIQPVIDTYFPPAK
jgi:lysophospholipase L1-like esterase